MSGSMIEFETRLLDNGFKNIVGIDEAGRGPLAGPVVAAAVILDLSHDFKYVNDSKKLSVKQREKALQEIKNHAISIGIGIVSNEEIDQINIYRATKKAMISAIDAIKIEYDYVLIDAMPILEIKIPNESIIRGDQKSISIAAASIIAKTTRDEYMKEMDKLFPEYGFAQHKGYPTKHHYEMLRLHGKTPIHRETFKLFK